MVHTRHQADYYHYVLENLKPAECVVVIDYKMKLELGEKDKGDPEGLVWKERYFTPRVLYHCSSK